MPTIFSLPLIILSMFGIADAGYITFEEFAGITPQCQNIPGFDCGAVLDSAWAHIGPFPVSMLGLLFYLTIFALAAAHLVLPSIHKNATYLLSAAATAGFLFTLFLVYLQAFIIGAFCFYCMISAVTSTLIFIVVTSYWLITLRKNNTSTESES